MNIIKILFIKSINKIICNKINIIFRLLFYILIISNHINTLISAYISSFLENSLKNKFSFIKYRNYYFILKIKRNFISYYV